MKLYTHPASTTSRPVMMFAADEGVALEHEVVDLFTGAQYQPPYLAINPNAQVPVLDDDGFILTESSAILKYLADKTGSRAYPQDLKARARVNEAMDWFNTGFYRTFGYGLCYAQLLDAYKAPDAQWQQKMVEANRENCAKYLRVLNDWFLRTPYVCGDEITLADYLGSGIVSLGDVIGCAFADYPNIAAWYERMRARPNWDAANGGLQYWVQAAKGPEYARI